MQYLLLSVTQKLRQCKHWRQALTGTGTDCLLWCNTLQPIFPHFAQDSLKRIQWFFPFNSHYIFQFFHEVYYFILFFVCPLICWSILTWFYYANVHIIKNSCYIPSCCSLLPCTPYLPLPSTLPLIQLLSSTYTTFPPSATQLFHQWMSFFSSLCLILFSINLNF